MTSDYSARLRKAGKEARQEAQSARAQERMGKGTPVTRSEIFDVLGVMQETLAGLVERIEALERKS